MLDEQELLKLKSLKDDELINAVKEDDLDALPPDLALKWCKARIKISNKLNAKLGEENRKKEIAKLEQEIINSLESSENGQN